MKVATSPNCQQRQNAALGPADETSAGSTDYQGLDQLGLPLNAEELKSEQVSRQHMEHANSSETSMLLHLSSEMADELLLESGLWEPFASERCAEASSSPDLATVFDHDVLDMSQEGPSTSNYPGSVAAGPLYAYFPCEQDLPCAMKEFGDAEANGVSHGLNLENCQDNPGLVLDDAMAIEEMIVHQNSDMTTHVCAQHGTDMLRDLDDADLLSAFGSGCDDDVCATDTLPAAALKVNFTHTAVEELRSESEATQDATAAVNYCDLTMLQDMVPNDSECEDAELDDFLSFLNGNDFDAFDAFAGMPIGLGAGKALDVPAGSPQPDVCAALQQEIGASQPYDILHQHGSVDSTLSRSLLAADKGKIGLMEPDDPPTQSVQGISPAACSFGVHDEQPPHSGKDLSMLEFLGDDGDNTQADGASENPDQSQQAPATLAAHRTKRTDSDDGHDPVISQTANKGDVRSGPIRRSFGLQACTQNTPADATAPAACLSVCAVPDSSSSALLQKVACSQQQLLNQLLQSGDLMLDAPALQRLRDDARRLQQSLLAAVPSLADKKQHSHHANDSVQEQSGAAAGVNCTAPGTAATVAVGNDKEAQSVGSCTSSRVTGDIAQCATDEAREAQPHSHGVLVKEDPGADARRSAPASPASEFSDAVEQSIQGSLGAAAVPGDAACRPQARRLRIKRRCADAGGPSNTNLASGGISGSIGVTDRAGCAVTMPQGVGATEHQHCDGAVLPGDTRTTAASAEASAACAPHGAPSDSDTITDSDAASDSDDEKDLRALAVHVSPTACPTASLGTGATGKAHRRCTADRSSPDCPVSGSAATVTCETHVEQRQSGTAHWECGSKAAPAKQAVAPPAPRDARPVSVHQPKRVHRSSNDSDATAAQPPAAQDIVAGGTASGHAKAPQWRDASSVPDPHDTSKPCGLVPMSSQCIDQGSAPRVEREIAHRKTPASQNSNQQPFSRSRCAHARAQAAMPKVASRPHPQQHIGAHQAGLPALPCSVRKDSVKQPAPQKQLAPTPARVPHVNPCKRPPPPLRNETPTGAREAEDHPAAASQASCSNVGPTSDHVGAVARAAAPQTTQPAALKEAAAGAARPPGVPEAPICPHPPDVARAASSARGVAGQVARLPSVATRHVPVQGPRSAARTALATQPQAPSLGATAAANPDVVVPRAVSCSGPGRACGAAAASRVAACHGAQRYASALPAPAVPSTVPCGPPPHAPPGPAARGGWANPSCAPNARYQPRVAAHKPVPPCSMPPPLLPRPCPPPRPPPVQHVLPFQRPVPPAHPPPPLQTPPAAHCAVASLADLSTLRDLLTCATKPPAVELPQPAPAPVAQPCRAGQTVLTSATNAAPRLNPRHAHTAPADAALKRGGSVAQPTRTQALQEQVGAKILKRFRLESPTEAEQRRSPKEDAAQHDSGSRLGHAANVAAAKGNIGDGNERKRPAKIAVNAAGKLQPGAAGKGVACKAVPPSWDSASARNPARPRKDGSHVDLAREKRPYTGALSSEQRASRQVCTPSAAGGARECRSGHGAIPRAAAGRSETARHKEDARVPVGKAAPVCERQNKRPRDVALPVGDVRWTKAPRGQGERHVDRPRRCDEGHEGRRGRGTRDYSAAGGAVGACGSGTRSVCAPRQPLHHMKQEVHTRVPRACNMSAASLPSDGDLFGC